MTLITPVPSVSKGRPVSIAGSQNNLVYGAGAHLIHGNTVISIFPSSVSAVSVCDELIAAADDRGNVRIFKITSDNDINCLLEFRSSPVKSLALSGNRLGVTGPRGGIVFDWKLNRQIAVLEGHAKDVTCITFSNHPGICVITGGDDFKICFYDSKYKFLKSNNYHSNFVNQVKVLFNNIFSCGSDGRLIKYNQQGDLDDQLHLEFPIYGMEAFNDSIVAVGRQTVFIDRATFQILRRVDSSTATLGIINLGNILVGVDTNGNILDSNDPHGIFKKGFQGAYTGIISLKGSSELYISTSDGIFGMIADGQVLIINDSLCKARNSMIFAIDENTVGFIDRNQKINFYSRGMVTQVSINIPQVTYLAACSKDQILLFSEKTSETILVLSGQPSLLFRKKAVTSISSNSRFFLVAYIADSTAIQRTVNLALYDSNGTLVWDIITPHQDSISSVCLASEGSLAASGDIAGRVIMYDGSSLIEDSLQFTFHKSRITAVKFLDNETLVSTSMDKQICVWNKSSLISRLRDAHKEGIVACDVLGKTVVVADSKVLNFISELYCLLFRLIFGCFA
jgi:WD40 repeat protein